MEYAQERIATLHDLSDARPDAPTADATVVVPMTDRECATRAAERVFAELALVEPARVVVALRASDSRAGAVADWLDGRDASTEVLWCDGPRVAALLESGGLDGRRGKGRDVWLALGRALDSSFVVVHDADARTYSRSYVPRLLFPLADGYEFSKGYYARVEAGRLYGRLFRLFYAPLVRALRGAHDAPVLEYLGAFRYALAGEFAATSELASRLRVPRTWGLEVGTLGDAFAAAGFDGTAQVDLGTYEHDHRAVGGPTGLSDMSRPVGREILRVAVDHGVEPDYVALPERYRETALRFVERYALDAAFNGLDFDRADERAQVEAYAEAIEEPTTDARLPPWRDAPFTSAEVHEAAMKDLAEVR
ncbi:glycosyl transferase family 2 [Halegenticoccus tardaugens]|uniref:glycosyl transferase family 2 n=1 Tax=Halegenticoccus tardaugens TaxID=2071624 RepID=UPI00100B932A|nr:glycosyl transferase family 2 [Halegenticoccus tardaugens]